MRRPSTRGWRRPSTCRLSDNPDTHWGKDSHRGRAWGLMSKTKCELPFDTLTGTSTRPLHSCTDNMRLWDKRRGRLHRKHLPTASSCRAAGGGGNHCWMTAHMLVLFTLQSLTCDQKNTKIRMWICQDMSKPHHPEPMSAQAPRKTKSHFHNNRITTTFSESPPPHHANTRGNPKRWISTP